jgi:hypothetical protein
LTESDFLRFFTEKAKDSASTVFGNLKAHGYGEDLLPLNEGSDYTNDPSVTRD